MAHLLAGKKVTYIQDWGQWKERWEKESCTEILHSLLHFGFSVLADSNEAIERLHLYLEIADNGDGFLRTFRGSNDRDFHRCNYTFGVEVKNEADLRKVLSQKAFQMLCQNFFKNTEKNNAYLFSWAEMVIIPQVLAKIFWFFRLDHDGYLQNMYFSEANEHQEKIARDFVHNLCLFVWDCGNWGTYSSYREITEEVRTAFYQARPDVITILSGLGELDLLLKGGRYKEIGKVCLDKLENIAFGYELRLPDASRKPLTIEEACFGGSQAARVLLALRIIQAEENRFQKIHEIEEQRLAGEKELQKLKRVS